ADSEQELRRSSAWRVDASLHGPELLKKGSVGFVQQEAHCESKAPAAFVATPHEPTARRSAGPELSGRRVESSAHPARSFSAQQSRQLSDPQPGFLLEIRASARWVWPVRQPGAPSARYSGGSGGPPLTQPVPARAQVEE